MGKSSGCYTQVRRSHVRSECPRSGSTSCRRCINGTYMNIPTGLKYCFPCRNCSPGSGLGIKRGCTKISDAVCEPLAGFFCVDPVEDGCLEARKHKQCRPGQYISLKGTPFNDTICSECIGGTFSNGTATVCQPHKICESNILLIKPGTASTDAECGKDRLRLWIVATILWGCVVVALLVSQKPKNMLCKA
ncbi:tumor necrosis factor receptor superfamily member 14-like isoform X2 [Syngnathoides biaculeatus]|uniref:tumor necrosis factor receptor superfamily member 14-like isoform X2 n=1 Tax=Syngnathoides biaculeatus TaxID=300417 RepID=UPI002ADDE13C|nr:tumor necrosis factor receptor superfamily member 14-like isoform X2 [Syngnathoides biaculeatus]